MRRLHYKKSRRVVPNNFEYTGIHKSEPVAMQLFVYNDHTFKEYTNLSISKLREILSQNSGDVLWLNVHGLHNTDFIKQVGELLDLETPLISDILNTTRRAKVEEFVDLLFFSIKSLLPKEAIDTIQVEQISFVLRGNLLVSFQEKRSDFFTHVRERIRTHAGIVRSKNSEYLLYLLLDAVMESFYITLEHFEDQTEQLISEVKTNSNQKILEIIERLRDDITFLKRSILPFREAVFNLKNLLDQHSSDGNSSNKTYFTRLHHKTLEILEQIEYDMNTVNSASNLFFSTQNQRMNQIMKTLTIFSVIFLPLTFIVGVYGMNFDNMPELHTRNGYYNVLWIMLAVAISMTIYFKKRKWF